MRLDLTVNRSCLPVELACGLKVYGDLFRIRRASEQVCQSEMSVSRANYILSAVIQWNSSSPCIDGRHPISLFCLYLGKLGIFNWIVRLMRDQILNRLLCFLTFSRRIQHPGVGLICRL